LLNLVRKVILGLILSRLRRQGQYRREPFVFLMVFARWPAHHRVSSV